MNVMWTLIMFMYWLAIDGYIHLLHLNIRKVRLYSCFLSIILTIIECFLCVFTGEVGVLLFLIIYILAIWLVFRQEIKTTFAVGMLAYGIGNAVYLVNYLLVLTVILIVNPNYEGSVSMEMYIVSGVLSVFIFEMIFGIKRLSRGLSLKRSSSVYIYLLILGMTIYAVLVGANFGVFKSGVDEVRFLISFYSICFGIIVIWQKSITRYYRKNLQRLKLDSYQQELEEKEARIRQLEENNEAMAQIIHRDNKLIPAMIASTRSFLRCADEVPQELAQRGAGLIAQLDEMAAGREGYLKSYESRREEVVHTSHSGVDGVITYMYDRARERKIQCEVKVDRGFEAVIPDRISELDCAHLLADLMDNARIATENCDSRVISVHLGVVSDFPVIEVSDSGAPFDPAVYQDFGLNKHSTHLGEGGSGIGLMDIWELKKKYRASLHIHEYAPGSGVFTKKLALVFDGKGHYLIQTYRHSELNARKLRGDLHIISAQ